MAVANKTKSGQLPKTFEALCNQHWPRPIRDDVDFANAQEIVNRLAVFGPDALTQGQAEYLETMTILMEDYEAATAAIETAKLNPIKTLKYLMDGRGMNASDLGRLLGNRALGSAILRGSRKLSTANMRTICRHFHVGAGLFVK
jgi:antitoxin component HigA of HigAB toxin-antitoxin module